METRKKILIVDDEQINVEFFDLMLSKLGFVVEKAANGREALDKIKSLRISSCSTISCRKCPGGK